MNRIVDRLVKAFNSRFHLGPIIMSMITIYFLVMPYDASGNFNLTVVFFTFLVLISTALMIIFLHYLATGKKEFIHLFNMAFLTMLLSILTLMLLKTMVILGPIPLLVLIISVFLFYSTLNELINHLCKK